MKFHQKSRLHSLFLIFILSCSILACSKDDDTLMLPPSTERGSLVSYVKSGSMQASEIVTVNQSLGDISPYAQFDLDIYSVVYNSIDAGSPLEVSGLVLVPQNTTGALDLIQHHHGTLIPSYDDGAEPSLYTGGNSDNSELSFIGVSMAANGYIVSLPDYVGYGVTTDREHPYTMHGELAEVSVDMLRATEQLLAELSINFSKDIFLTGWSEGGGAGLATHKFLEEKYPNEFNLRGSSLLAGPYDYFGFFKDIMTNREAENVNLSIYSWATYSLNKLEANLQQNTNLIWNYSVNSQLDAINIPSNKPADIFQATFMDNFVNETDANWVNAVKSNSLIENWIPQANVYLHSGTEDFIVPHYNSTRAHAYFQSVGATSALYEYDGGDHYTPEFDYVTTTLDDFKNL